MQVRQDLDGCVTHMSDRHHLDGCEMQIFGPGLR